DKLNENRNMSELFQETKELNELMKSYIRVHMNEEMAKEVTIHNQLNQIQEKSDKVMSNMQSILNTQGKMLEENAENLRSEEHTSELQSRFDLVCRLLLEKKKSVTKMEKGT